MITKEKAKEVHEKFTAAVKAFAKENGLEFSGARCVWNPEDMTIRVKFGAAIETPKPYNDRAMLAAGLAPRGSLVLFKGKRAIITEARQTKYAFYYEDEPTKSYICVFTAFQPMPTEVEA